MHTFTFWYQGYIGSVGRLGVTGKKGDKVWNMYSMQCIPQKLRYDCIFV